MLKKTITFITITGLRQFCRQGFRPAMAIATSQRDICLPNSINIFQQNVCFYSTPAGVLSASYDEVKDLPNHPEKLLIDVREPDELKEFGKIPTSINIPLGIVADELASKNEVFKAKYGREKPGESTEIIFHCRIGKRSGMAAETAIKMGYKNVKNYQGSWLDWADREGLPK